MKRHIRITENNNKLILMFMEKNKINNYTQAINELLEIALLSIEKNKEIDLLLKLSKRSLAKTDYLINLLEQIYSDFNLDDITDPRKSISLKKFKERINRSEDD